MNTDLVAKLSSRLSNIGTINSRSMFGGFGLFCDETMFGLVVGDEFYIRASGSTEDEFLSLGMEPYSYAKRGFPIVTKYYKVPYTWTKDQTLEQRVVDALNLAKEDKKKKEKGRFSRLKDLPNLRLTLERMLKRSGVDSVAYLKEIGSVEAFKAMRATYGDISINILWALEGAITGVHASVISPETKKALINDLKGGA